MPRGLARANLGPWRHASKIRTRPQPSRRISRVEPSMSVSKNVTMPPGSDMDHGYAHRGRA
jgi:hypothetical protein